MPELISTGNVIVDIVLTVDHLPEPGGDIIATSSRITAGGGLNTLVAARRAGLRTVFAGQYGTGPMGDVVRAALAASGARVIQSGVDDTDSGYCVAFVDASTERTFITTVGAEGHLTREDLDRVPVADDDLVHISGYSLAHPSNAAALTAWLPTLPTTTKVLFDPSPLIGDLDPATVDKTLRRTDVLSTNAREATIMTGSPTPAHAAATLLPALRPDGLVVVRDGAAGCWLACPSTDPVLVPGYPVNAIDTNGAGDAHAGVLAAGLLSGLTPPQAARRANAAAAIAVTKPGPATAPTAAEVDDFLRDRP